MPIFLEPDQKHPAVLSIDKDKPVATRPTFHAKSQSMRGQKKIADVIDRLFSDPTATTEQLHSDATEMLSEVLVGWSNMNGIEYSKEAIQDVLSYTEARELLTIVYHNQHVTPEQKKSSE